MIRADKRKYHYIYKTTCLITNRYYIGMHSTENLEDGYIGSGKKLWYSIKKYGRENHKCEILEFLPSRKELALRENQIINKELLINELCLNLKVGGEYGWSFRGPNLTHEQRVKAGKAAALISGFGLKEKRGKEWLEKCKLKIQKASSEGRFDEARLKGCSAAQSPEAKEKRKETLKRIGHQQGGKNSSYGTCWISHELMGTRKCKKELLPEYIEQGWIKGRKQQIF